MSAHEDVQPSSPRPNEPVMTEFAYTELTPDTSEIRLMRLQPGDQNAPIACTVDVHLLNDNPSLPEYETLSYAWGGEGEKQDIKVNEDYNLKIGKNLWDALRRIRKADGDRTLWVDAICINQSDRDEKEKQLPRVGAIYKNCKNCMIWLGVPSLPTPSPSTSPGAADSPPLSAAAAAIELLGMFASCLPTSGGVKHLSQLECFTVADAEREPRERTDVNDSYTGHFEALTALLKLDWWKRTWVIQELALPAHIEFLVDDKMFQYEDLKKAVEGLVYHSTRACCKKHRLGLRALGFEAVVTMEEKIASMVFVRQQRLDNKHITFTQLRRRFCGSQVSWKRDFFYGFLGIVTGSTPLSPSYKLPLRTAISEATYACVTKETDGVALLLGERLFRSQNPYTRLHVPSWVSDACFCTFPQKWGLVERRRLSMYESFNAGQNGAGQSSPRQNSAERQTFVNNLSMSKNGILVTESYQIGKIDEVGDVLVDTNQWMTVPRVLLSWMEMAGINPLTWPASPVDLDEGKMVFWRTMINDSVEKDGDDSVEEVGESPQYQRPSIAESYQELHKLWEAIGHRTLRAFFPTQQC